MTAQLSQVDSEALVGWMDGELDADQAAQVAGRVQADPAWRTAHDELRRLDAALDELPVPTLRRGLTADILRQARRQQFMGRVIRIVAPAAAAAAVLLAAFLAWPQRPGAPVGGEIVAGRGGVGNELIDRIVDDALPDVARGDRDVVHHLNLVMYGPQLDAYGQVRDLADPATLEAIQRLEGEEM